MYEYEDAPQSDAEQIEISIGVAKNAIEAKAALDRLRKNSDFKKVFLTMYLETESARLTTLLAHPAYQKEEQQADVINQLRSISMLGQYMTRLHQFGAEAENAMVGHEAELDRARTEGE